MSDLFAARGEQIQQRLLEKEQHAREEELFPLGYMIPQIELVLERAEYEVDQVDAEDFDVTYWGFLEQTFAEDGMSSADQATIKALWESVAHA